MISKKFILVLFMGVFGFLFAGVALINWLFVSSINIPTAWEASDALAFFGVVFTGSSAIFIFFGNHLHRDWEKRVQKENERWAWIGTQVRLVASKITRKNVANIYFDQIREWRINTQLVYDIFEELSLAVGFANFLSPDERNLLSEEFSEIQLYAQSYMALILKMHSLLVASRNLEEIIKMNAENISQRFKLMRAEGELKIRLSAEDSQVIEAINTQEKEIDMLQEKMNANLTDQAQLDEKIHEIRNEIAQLNETWNAKLVNNLGIIEDRIRKKINKERPFFKKKIKSDLV